jgi:hypothetical protein
VSAPVAPWALQGESLVALARCRSGVGAGALPAGTRRLPGPCLVVANRYVDSPVGPYLELAIGQPARLGPRPGWCFTTMVVDNADARKGGQLNWGFPKELGRLLWRHDGDERELRWVERDLCVRGVPGRLVLPFLVPMRSLQRRADGPVVVPARLRGRARTASVVVYAPQDDPLSGLAGTHRGLHLSSMKYVVRPARHPVGIASTLLAPLRAPEPALVSSAPGD